MMRESVRGVLQERDGGLPGDVGNFRGSSLFVVTEMYFFEMENGGRFTWTAQDDATKYRFVSLKSGRPSAKMFYMCKHFKNTLP